VTLSIGSAATVGIRPLDLLHPIVFHRRICCTLIRYGRSIRCTPTCASVRRIRYFRIRPSGQPHAWTPALNPYRESHDDRTTPGGYQLRPLHFSHFSLSPRVCSRSLSLTPGDQRSLSPSDQRYLCRIVPRSIGVRLLSDIWRGGKPGELSCGNPGDCTDNPLSSMAGNYQAKFSLLKIRIDYSS
jgi:hypothetical protein